MKILIIEDARTSALQAQWYCEQQPGWYAEIAHNLTEGIALLEQQPFDCILLDLILPEVHDWRETIPKLKKISDLPLVVLTSKESAHGTDVECECLLLGAQEFVRKGSLDMNDIDRAVRKAVARKEVEKRLMYSIKAHESLRQGE